MCTRNLNGTKASNLTSHLQSHPDIYSKVCREDPSIEYKRQKLLLDCVELVGRAFKCLNDSAIHSMNDEILKELQAAGRELNLRDPHLVEIKEEFRTISKEIRDKIAIEVKNRALSLLVDIVSKRGRSIIGISIQYVLNKKVTIRSIGMIELEEKHTGKYLADLIIERLKELNIDLKQIITITTDNGANVLKMIRDMEYHLQSSINEATQPSTPSKSIQNLEENTSHEIETILSTEAELTDEEAIDLILQEADCDEIQPTDTETQSNQELLEAIHMNMQNSDGLDIFHITGVNCVVHTLQLAISDSIKTTTKENRNLMDLSRRVAKILRLANTVRLLKENGIDYKRPHIDVVTRWGSLYQMVNISVLIILIRLNHLNMQQFEQLYLGKMHFLF